MFIWYLAYTPVQLTSSPTSGLLLHISSLPGSYGIGDLGYEAYAFADFLHAARQSVWQVLPIVPVGHGNSPYSSPSTFAGNILLVSPDLLLDYGLLTEDDLATSADPRPQTVHFKQALDLKHKVLSTAWRRFSEGNFAELKVEYESFRVKNGHWLTDYALYEAIKTVQNGSAWTEWPAGLRDRETTAVADFVLGRGPSIEQIMFSQFVFDKQWTALRAYCDDRKIALFGDLPIYVAQDSADVWANRDIFFLDAAGHPTVVSGVPPDYFSETGQRWGNPLYRWEVLKSRDYDWWVARMQRILDQFDLVRLDHFRGFEAYWEIPSTEATAVRGTWRDGPAEDLFESLERHLGTLPVIAENLGVITEGVTRLIDAFGFPGMALLQFAFDSGPENGFLPHNYDENIVAYTGTHDNDTMVGWWTDTSSTQNADQIERERQYCAEYLELSDSKKNFSGSELTWKAISALMNSSARFVITPVQDVLSLDSSARMNTPGTTDHNWAWRMQKGSLTPEIAAKLGMLTRETHRARKAN